jgi:hypothetical protein
VLWVSACSMVTLVGYRRAKCLYLLGVPPWLNAACIWRNIRRPPAGCAAGQQVLLMSDELQDTPRRSYGIPIGRQGLGGLAPARCCHSSLFCKLKLLIFGIARISNSTSILVQYFFVMGGNKIGVSFKAYSV